MGRLVSGSNRRKVTVSGLINPRRILSSGSWIAPCNVSPENPAKSITTCSRVNACSMKGRRPIDGAANTDGPAIGLPAAAVLWPLANIRSLAAGWNS